MIFTKSSQSHNAADSSARPLEHAMSSPQQVAEQALDKLAGTAQDVRRQVAPLLERAGEQAGALVQRGANAVRDRALDLREQSLRASDSTLSYIRDEPFKAVLIAAAAGAALVAVLGLLRRSD